MNQNFYNSNSSGFDQLQPPQYPVIHNPPQETSVEILQAKEDLMKSIQTFLKKFNRISFGETPKVLLLAWEKFFEIQHAKPEDIQELLHKLLKDLQIISEDLSEFINCPSWNRPTFYDDDDEEYTIQYREYLENSSKAIAPDLPTEEPDNSLSMGDEHLSTIPETESDEVIKSSVENLVPIPRESEGISDDTCDVPVCENSSTFDALKNHSLILSDSNDDGTSSDDDDFEDIEYVEASPPDSELVSLEEVNDVDQEKEEIDLEDILRIQDSPSSFLIPVMDSDSFFEEFDTSLSYSVNSLPEFETFSDHKEETISGSTTTHADNSLLEYDSFHFEIEPDQGELTNVVMETILGEPRVHMFNILPTQPTLDSDFTPSDDSLGSGLEVSFPSGSRNKIFDPGIFIQVQSERLLSQDAFVKATLKERIFHGVNEKTSLQALRTQFKEFLASKRGNEGSSESRLATQTSKDFNTLGVFRMKENELSMRLKENEPENTMHSNKSETETADGKGKRKRSICDEAVDTDIGPVNDEEHLLEDKKVSPNKSSAVHEKATTLLDLVLGGSTVPTVVDKYLGTQLDDALLKILERHTADLIEKYSVLPGPESIKNQESEKSPKEIIRIKREQGKEKQDFNYSIRPQGKLIVDDDKVDDDDEGPSAGSTGRSGKEKKDPIMPLLALTSPGWAVTDTRDDVNSAMPSI
ncbi:hypothetical protein Tco_1166356 [Tanacetum coccineum]